MTDTKLRALVDEAVTLDREIRRMDANLKSLKADLTQEAETRLEEHVPTDGGGTSWTAVGTDGCMARVTFAAPTLKGSISGVGKTIEKVMQVAGKAFALLFEQTPAWKPGTDFRAKAEILLDKREAGRLIKLVTSETAPRVSFETKPEEDAR